jgi:hypothetical protein
MKIFVVRSLNIREDRSLSLRTEPFVIRCGNQILEVIMREIIRLSAIASFVVIVLLFSAPNIFGQIPSEDLTTQSLTLRVENESLITCLATLAVEYRVPIGLEVAFDHDDNAKLNFDVKNESLKKILDLICRQEPSYRWEVRDGVINFVPRDSTDQFLSKLLDTNVSRFAPQKGVNKFGLRNSVADLPEVKTFLSVNDLTISRLEYPTYPSVYSNADLDLSISNTNVRGVLNKIIRVSEHKLWIMKRGDEKMRTVQISL